jgi:hypothetical protein
MDTRKGRNKETSEETTETPVRKGSTFDSLKGLLQSRDRTKKIVGTLLFGLPIIVVFYLFRITQR